MDSPAVVEASGLRVTYASRRGTVEALKGLDLRIPKGSLFVLLGPNGAGKTTLMRCITALVRPTAGSIRVFGGASGDGPAETFAGGPLDGPRGRSGFGPRGGPAEGPEGSSGGGSGDIRRGGSGGKSWRGGAGPEGDRAERLRRIGVLIENPGAYGRLDAREYLSFFGSFYGKADPGALEARIEELCAGFGLALDGKRVSKLSQGNRQKLQLVRSLLHSPSLLLWDEPTDHLDPEAQARVLGYLGSYLRREGATALLATHRLEQMEGLGTHFGFLKEGRLVLAGTRAEILGGGEEAVRVTFASAPAAAALERAAGDLGLAAAASDGSAVFSGRGMGERLPALVKALALADLPIRAVEPVRTTLSEVYGKAMAA